MEHYFTSDPSVKSEERNIIYKLKEKEFIFISDNGVFSKNHVDSATDLLLRTIYDHVQGNVLDIGCGYGVIGITLATCSLVTKVKMLDVNHRALDLAKRNAFQNRVGDKIEVIESDGLQEISDEEKFDYIITNPPIRAGKVVIYQMYEDAKNHLVDGGKLVLVINKKHGAPSTITFLESLYDDVQVLDKKAGFHVIECTK